jgi:hypothetical protein
MPAYEQRLPISELATHGCTPCDHTTIGWWPLENARKTTLLRLFPRSDRKYNFHGGAVVHRVTTRADLVAFCKDFAPVDKFHSSVWQKTLADVNFYLQIEKAATTTMVLPSSFLTLLASHIIGALHAKLRIQMPQSSFVQAAVQEFFTGAGKPGIQSVAILTKFGTLLHHHLIKEWQDDDVKAWLETAIAADVMSRVSDQEIQSLPVIPFARVLRVASKPSAFSLQEAAASHVLTQWSWI